MLYNFQEITNFNDFKKWVKTQLILRDMTQKQLAGELGIAYPRITEAIEGKPTGKKHIIPIIIALDGDLNSFQKLLECH